MNKLLKFAAAGIAAAAMQLPAIAAPVLDQNNPGGAGMGGFCFAGVGALCGQSFKQDGATISGAGIYISPGYAHGDATLTVSIFSTYNSAPSGLLATGSTSFASGFSGWADVFWAPVAASPATQYYMVLGADNSSVVAAYSVQPAYANGNALYAGSVNGWIDYDLVFRTFADDGAAQAVPEPGSFALLGLGLAALGFAARRKRS